MRVFAFVLALAAMTGIASAAASDDLVAPPQAFVDAFNAGDGTALAKTCVANAPIIDDFAPFVWHGCDTWYKAFLAMSTKAKLTENKVTITGKPQAKLVDGNTAYVVLPVKYTYKDHGKAATMTGAVWTASLQKVDGAWKISGWAWADH